MRTLESKNKLLEAEIEALKSRYSKPSGLRQLYEAQLKDLTRAAEQMRIQRVRKLTVNDCKNPCVRTKVRLFLRSLQSTYQDMSVEAKEAVLGQLDALKAKFKEAVEARKKVEQDIETVRPVREKLIQAD